MNTPNKLTVLRVLLVPAFLCLMMISEIPLHYLGALVIFVAASVTDTLDGYLARKNNQVTTFGKFLDPLADKILVLSALICFIELKFCGAIPVVIIIAREFMVTSIRLVALSSDGKVIAANFWGKLKTVISMVAIITVLILAAATELFSLPNWLQPTFWGPILIWLATAITVISGLDYLIKNRQSINGMR